MNISIDIGNTQTKIGFFEGNLLVQTSILINSHLDNMKQVLNDYQNKNHKVIVSSVINLEKDFLEYFNFNFDTLIFTSTTPIPIFNFYHSPLSLGMDRLAAVIGSNFLFKDKNRLVIDAGTCITYDLITYNNEYLGGGISPGIRMRFKALNNYTGKLPLVETIEKNNMIGRTTIESIKSGVINGIIAEINGIIEKYSCSYRELQVLITGGDSPFLVINLKNSIFAAPHLVLQGLNEVLIYNKTDNNDND